MENAETKPKILLVNDDGIDAPGLWLLYDKLQSLAQCLVVAPKREQSGRSHAVTVRQQMSLEKIERNGGTAGYALDGMPADCVKLALSRLYKDRIDLVISGINPGSNAGTNVLYSGTVAAAIEAAMYGVPAIAVSLRDDRRPPTQFETAARVSVAIAKDVLRNGLPPRLALNVNVPDLPIEQIDGSTVTRMGHECYIDVFTIHEESDGAKWCMNVGEERIPSKIGKHPVDDEALAQNRVSITPLHCDLTSRKALKSMNSRFESLLL